MQAIRFKTTSNRDLYNPLKAWITENFGEDEAKRVEADLIDVDKSRRAAVMASAGRPDAAVQTYLDYYKKISVLDKRIRFTAQGGGGVTIKDGFGWTDAYNTTYTGTLYDIKFEKCNVLFNLAATYSLMGTQNSTANFVQSFKDYSAAAGVFLYLKDSPETGCASKGDLLAPALEFALALMKAQAQVQYLSHAQSKKMKPGVLKVLAIGAHQLYEEAWQAITGSGDLKTWLQNAPGQFKWREHCKHQSNVYLIDGLRFEAARCNVNGDYGERVTRLRECDKLLGLTAPLAKSTTSNANNYRLKIAAIVAANLKEAESDNLDIYHLRVYANDELAKLQAKIMVNAKKFEVGDLGNDPYRNLIPKHILTRANSFKVGLLDSEQQVRETGKKSRGCDA